ncbi:M23 family peptidase [Oceanidesulfovibrio indonesiensis]|uniref:M23 family peptidase n=1 Tax=Oceanidesulfovibrio indonesiensis TaxID=54767 RepID=A0A7M3MG67_9BACT|nr:M23 family metallopeptidase [Oceanidesulfovibrio indonesiensis]TVM18249.1 M23 family peptidase [Oceanidesulfovibrio indonesiensis]
MIVRGAILFAALWMIVLYSAPTLALDQRIGPVVLSVPDNVVEGHPFMVTVRSKEPMPDIECEWEGHVIRLHATSERGEGFVARLLLGIGLSGREETPRSDSYPLTVRVRSFEDTYEFNRAVLRIPGDYPVQRLTVPEKYSELSTEDLSRHEREKAAVQEALATFTPERFWQCPMRRPVPGDVSSIFGLQRFMNDEPRQPHGGVDLRAGYGTPVNACWEGRVILTGDHFFAGKSVFVDHGQGVVSMYFHLAEIMAQEGQRVMPGEVIGRVGSSGRVTGPHLHFGLSIFGAAVDPLPLMGPDCENAGYGNQ